ncbi:MAG: hypothetical protein LT070_11780 [Solirubrobacteraceae bacterium]|nr:hypothetical protein [Solirubrobacteraceae bacterium]
MYKRALTRISREPLGVAALALALLGGGSAFAAATINGAQIKKGTITGAHVKGGSLTGADVKKGTLTGAHVKDGSLTGADVKKGTITGAHVKDGSLGSADLAPSLRSAIEAPGPAGQRGPAGPQGPQGPQGQGADPDGLEYGVAVLWHDPVGPEPPTPVTTLYSSNVPDDGRTGAQASTTVLVDVVDGDRLFITAAMKTAEAPDPASGASGHAGAFMTVTETETGQMFGFAGTDPSLDPESAGSNTVRIGGYPLGQRGPYPDDPKLADIDLTGTLTGIIVVTATAQFFDLFQ